MRERAVGIVIKDGKVLLIRRIKKGGEYFVFPGGKIEEDETPEHAVVRELKEETTLDIKINRLLFNLVNQFDEYGGYHKGYPNEHYFLVTDFDGTVELGGPEKIKMNEDNQYHLEWHELHNIQNLSQLYPADAVKKIIELNL